MQEFQLPVKILRIKLINSRVQVAKKFSEKRSGMNEANHEQFKFMMDFVREDDEESKKFNIIFSKFFYAK
jgi:ferritin